MIRRLFGKVMWLGRATSALVGLVVLFALAIGAANSALAHTNVDTKLFHLGHNNPVRAISALTGTLTGAVLKLDNNGTGTALQLDVGENRAPLKVNAAAGTATNLSADELDGKNSTEFAPQQVEAWHNVGTQGEPAFTNGWRNAISPSYPVAFYKDPWGVVHLKGLAEGSQGGGTSGALGIFDLPCGYAPDQDSQYQVLAYTNTAALQIYRMDPCGNGQYTARVFSGGRRGPGSASMGLRSGQLAPEYHALGHL